MNNITYFTLASVAILMALVLARNVVRARRNRALLHARLFGR